MVECHIKGKGVTWYAKKRDGSALGSQPVTEQCDLRGNQSFPGQALAPKKSGIAI